MDARKCMFANVTEQLIVMLGETAKLTGWPFGNKLLPIPVRWNMTI